MANRIILKKSSVQGKVPSSGDLEFGELAVNFADGKIYYKDSNSDIASFSKVTDSDDVPEGTSNLYFTTARANSAIDTRVDQGFVNALNVDADTLDGEDGSYYIEQAIAFAVALG